MPYEEGILGTSNVMNDNSAGSTNGSTSSTSTSSTNPAILLMRERLSKLETISGRTKGLSYKARSNDILLATPPKSGTTWTQHICHQIRYFGQLYYNNNNNNNKEKQQQQQEEKKNGSSCCSSTSASSLLDDIDLDIDTANIDHFNEVTEVSPWIELAYDCGQDLEHDIQPYSEHIRLLKTHCWYDHSPKNFHKTIVVYREPEACLRSFYNFFEDWWFEKGSISHNEFATEFWLKRGTPKNHMQNPSYFVHLISWYKRYEELRQRRRSSSTASNSESESESSSNNNKNNKHDDEDHDDDDDDEILYIFYEDLVSNTRHEIIRIAKFLSDERMNYNIPSLISIVEKCASFTYMKKHETKFNESLTKRRNVACNMPHDAGTKTSKVSGKRNNKIIFDDKVRNAIQQQWIQVVTPITGCKTYQEFHHMIQQKQQQDEKEEKEEKVKE